MRSGDLTHRVVIQRPTETRDAFGDPVVSWTQLAQVWAAVDFMAGAESFQGDREYAQVPVTVRIRRSTDVVSVREKDRVLVPMGATTLRNAIGNSTATSMVVDDAGVFPPENDFTVRVETELVNVTAGAGTVASPYTVTRGAYGSTAARHQANVSAIHMAALDIVGVAMGGGRDRHGRRIDRSEIHLTTVRSEVRAL